MQIHLTIKTLGEHCDIEFSLTDHTGKSVMTNESVVIEYLEKAYLDTIAEPKLLYTKTREVIIPAHASSVIVENLPYRRIEEYYSLKKSVLYHYELVSESLSDSYRIEQRTPPEQVYYDMFFAHNPIGIHSRYHSNLGFVNVYMPKENDLKQVFYNVLRYPLKLTPNMNGVGELRLDEILDSELTYTPPPSILPYELPYGTWLGKCPDGLRPFTWISSNDADKLPYQSTASAGKLSYVLKGGLKREHWQWHNPYEPNLNESWFKTPCPKPFLTWQRIFENNNRKKVVKWQKEYLYYLISFSPCRQVQLIIQLDKEIKDKDGTPRKRFVLNSYSNSEPVNLIVCDVSPAFVSSWISDRDKDARISWYAIHLEDEYDRQISEVKMYEFVDYSSEWTADDVVLVYRNSLGGLDTIRLRGIHEKDQNLTIFETERTDESMYHVSDFQQFVYDKYTVDSFSFRTGYVYKHEIEYLQDLVLSKEVYEQRPNGEFLPLIVDAKSFKVSVVKSDLHYATIQVKRAWKERKYSRKDGSYQIDTPTETIPVALRRAVTVIVNPSDLSLGTSYPIPNVYSILDGNYFTFKPLPIPSAKLYDCLINGVSQSQVKPYEDYRIKITGDTVIRLVYVINGSSTQEIGISVVIDGVGSVNNNNSSYSYSISSGLTQVFAIVPSPNCKINSVKVNGLLQSIEERGMILTLSNITTAQEIAVDFVCGSQCVDGTVWLLLASSITYFLNAEGKCSVKYRSGEFLYKNCEIELNSFTGVYGAWIEESPEICGTQLGSQLGGQGVFYEDSGRIVGSSGAKYFDCDACPQQRALPKGDSIWIKSDTNPDVQSKESELAVRKGIASYEADLGANPDVLIIKKISKDLMTETEVLNTGCATGKYSGEVLLEIGERLVFTLDCGDTCKDAVGYEPKSGAFVRWW